MSKAYIEVFRHIGDKQIEYVNTIACKTKALVRDGVIYWSDYVGEIFDYCYMGIHGQFTVLNYNNKTSVFTLRFDEYDLEHTIGLKPFKKASFMNIFKIRYHKLKIGDVHSNKRIVGISYNIKNKSIVYEYQCLTDGYVGKALESNLLKSKDRCPVCLGDVVVAGINDIPTTEPWMTDYFVGGYDEAKKYTKNNNSRVTMKCPYCNTNKKVIIYDLYRLSGIGCRCTRSMSYPEKLISAMLDYLGIRFIHQCGNAVLPWITDRFKYDFYLPDYSIIIETHGLQHYKALSANSKWTPLDVIQERDNKKYRLAKDNGVKHYIVLDCSKSDLSWIRNSVERSELSTMLEISAIDWAYLHNATRKNFHKEVCEYVNKHPDQSRRQVSEVFHIHPATVRNYLKVGEKYGWVQPDMCII